MSEYTADELRKEALYWQAKAERLREMGTTKFTVQHASDLAHAENADELLRAGADAMDRVKVLEEALRWYGSRGYNCNNYTTIGDVGRDALAKDGGARARAALQVKPKPDAPGTGWKLSDEAKKDIAEIERHAKFYR